MKKKKLKNKKKKNVWALVLWSRYTWYPDRVDWSDVTYTHRALTSVTLPAALDPLPSSLFTLVYRRCWTK
jgi:hypothetical protein